MIRSQKYNIGEGGASYHASHTQGDSKSEFSSIELGSTMTRTSTVSSKAPIIHQKPTVSAADGKLHWTWIPLIVVGVMAATFLGCMYGFPNSPVHLVSVGSEHYPSPYITNRTNKQGKLVIFPQVPEHNSSVFPDHYFISMAPNDLASNSEIIKELTGAYPHHAADTPPPEPYVHCWLEHPSSTKPCFYDRGWFGRKCSELNDFGYKNTEKGLINPCFVVRVEDSGSWLPRNLLPHEVGNSFQRDFDPSFIGFECRPKNRKSRKDISINRYPVKGFPLPFFPMDKFNPTDYLYPAIMVQVEGIPQGENTTIECWIRSPNSFYLLDSGSFEITFTWPSKDEAADGSSSRIKQNPGTTQINDSNDSTTSTAPKIKNDLPNSSSEDMQSGDSSSEQQNEITTKKVDEDDFDIAQ